MEETEKLQNVGPKEIQSNDSNYLHLDQSIDGKADKPSNF